MVSEIIGCVKFVAIGYFLVCILMILVFFIKK